MTCQSRSELGWWQSLSMDVLDAAFQKVRRELAEVGLLEPTYYLDRIDCVRSPLPLGFLRECGWVYDGDPGLLFRLVGLSPGVIYLPINPPVDAHRPGATLLDVLRHEYAHTWYWLDPEFVDGEWFRETFGASYGDAWDESPDFERNDFVSSYACTRPKEDFAETFMFFMKYRRSLHRFRRRGGLARKLDGVRDAVEQAAAERVRLFRETGESR